jgi:hypothetical protein
MGPLTEPNTSVTALEKPSARRPLRAFAMTVTLAGLCSPVSLMAGRGVGPSGLEAYDPLLSEPGNVCGPAVVGRPPLLQKLILAQSETKPFKPQAMQAAAGQVPLYDNLGKLSFKVGTRDAKAQAYFDQGIRWAFAFNHAEAQRAFQAAQKADPKLAMAWWGEALVLGPNINAPMMPEAVAPALAALAKAVELAPSAPAKDRALIAALQKRYSADPKAERAALDAAYADAMKSVAEHSRSMPSPQWIRNPGITGKRGAPNPRAAPPTCSRRWRRCSSATRTTQERSTSTSTRSRHRRGPIARCRTRGGWPP